MKKEKITKEDLIKKVAILEKDNQEWFDANERRKKEFAKIFNWSKPDYYSREQEIIIPSWEQIFTEVGKLLAARNFYDFEGNISELECKLENLEQKIRKEIHPNL